MNNFSTISVLANPVAGSGLGAHLGARLASEITALFAKARVDVLWTRNREHVLKIAGNCTSDLLVCLCGDGTLHDVAQILMQRPYDERPTIAVVPIGSGNDYARTLGIVPASNPDISWLAQGSKVAVDVGRVNDVYFLETLSFGMDAAVALNTEVLRKTTQTTGVRLYARAAIDAILHELKPHRVRFALDGQVSNEDFLILAVQNGPTYGSGFKVAPQASLADGALDVCAIAPVNTLKALYYLARIKNGSHQQLKAVRMYKATTVTLDFDGDGQVPIQCDGEPLLGTHFEITVEKTALDVLVPANSPVL